MVDGLMQHNAIARLELVDCELGEQSAVRVACIIPNPELAPEVHRACAIESQVHDKGLDIFEPDASLSMVHKNKREADFLYREIFKNNEYLRNGIYLRDDAVVVDVGANVGMVSILIGKLYPDAKIFAIEPVKLLCDAIELNVQLHGVDIKVFNCAIGKGSGTISYTYYPKNTAMSGAFADQTEDRETLASYFAAQRNDENNEDLSAMIAEVLEGQTLECEMHTLAELLQKEDVSQIDLLKIDVEKAELDVLNGIDAELWNKVQQMVVEVHDINNRLALIEDMLKQRGFNTLTDRNDDMTETNMFTVYASRQPIATEDRVLSWSKDGIYPTKQSIITALEQAKGEVLADKYVFFNELPVDADGQLLLDQIRKEIADGGTGVEHADEMTSDVEEKMADIWKRILKVDQIGKSDDFFALGGSSLTAVRLIVEVEKEFGEDILPPDQLFNVSVFRDVVSIVEEAVQI